MEEGKFSKIKNLLILIFQNFSKKKVSLDFLSLLGYQIANYLGPLNSKHWIKHHALVEDKDQSSALDHLFKNPNPFYQSPVNSGHFLNTGLSNSLLDQSHLFNNDEFATAPDAFGTPHNANQFLNNDSFFSQNYFKDNSLLNEKLNGVDDIFLNPSYQASTKLQLESEPIVSSSLTNDQKIKATSSPIAFQSGLIKDKELNNQFFTNQLLNNKLLSEQLINDKLIDFRTKEQLQQVIKPIKITQND